MDTLVQSHTGKETMGYLYNTIGKNRLISLRKKAWQEPGIVEHSPRSPDTNSCDYFSKLPDGYKDCCHPIGYWNIF